MKYKKIKIGETEYPIAFGMFALSEFLEEVGLTLSELGNLGSSLTLKQALKLAYIGFEDGARKAKEEFDLSFEDVCDLFDDDQDALQNVLGVFADSLPEGGNEKKTMPPQRRQKHRK